MDSTVMYKVSSFIKALTGKMNKNMRIAIKISLPFCLLRWHWEDLEMKQISPNHHLGYNARAYSRTRALNAQSLWNAGRIIAQLCMWICAVLIEFCPNWHIVLVPIVGQVLRLWHFSCSLCLEFTCCPKMLSLESAKML